MNQPRSRYEGFLFAAALVCALAVRFIGLGNAPLTDSEASWAMQALNLANSQGLSSQVVLGPQPAYIFLTALLFYLFGASQFLARFWPALVGAFLILFPWLARSKIGPTAAILAAFGLALDPGLVAVSRQAGSPMMALGFSLLALGLWIDRRAVFAGLLAGLALLSGPSIYPGLIGLAAAGLITSALHSTPILNGRQSAQVGLENSQEDLSPVPTSGQPSLRQALLAAGLTILIGGTFFLRYPQGLAAWIDSLVVYVNGWGIQSGISAARMAAALFFFQPLALFFAFLGIIRWLFRNHRDPLQTRSVFIFVLIWLVAIFILSMIYPSRQISDLVWVLVPLWLVAAWELRSYLPDPGPNLISLLHAGLVLILFGLFYFTLFSTSQLSSGGIVSPQITQAILLLGILALGVLTSVLVALGWNLRASQLGAAWGILAAALIYLTAALWGAAYLRPNQPSELWSALPGNGQADLISTTLDDFSKRSTGLLHNLELVSLLDSPSIRWLLRDYPNARFSSSLSPSERPAAVISSVVDELPAWTAAYRGQDFVWWTWPGWEGTLPEKLVNWIVFRDAPLRNEKIILWVRSDLFPGGVLTTDQGEALTP
jgi:hypothetical protein